MAGRQPPTLAELLPMLLPERKTIPREPGWLFCARFSLVQTVAGWAAALYGLMPG